MTRPAGKGGGDESRPYCINCRRAMYSITQPGKRPRWACSVCRASCPRHGGPRIADECNPYCLRCRRPMKSCGVRRWPRWACVRCGTYIPKRTRHDPSKRLPDELRPRCPNCRRPMWVSGRPGRFVCPCARPTPHDCGACARCAVELAQVRERPDELLRQLDDALAGLQPDLREDARQSPFLAVLAGELPPHEITPKALRPYARAARGMTQTKYRFVSLSMPLPNGGTFGELIEG